MSQLRCARLQLMQAEVTWALERRPLRDEPEPGARAPVVGVLSGVVVRGAPERVVAGE